MLAVRECKPRFAGLFVSMFDSNDIFWGSEKPNFIKILLEFRIIGGDSKQSSYLWTQG